MATTHPLSQTPPHDRDRHAIFSQTLDHSDTVVECSSLRRIRPPVQGQISSILVAGKDGIKAVGASALDDPVQLTNDHLIRTLSRQVIEDEPFDLEYQAQQLGSGSVFLAILFVPISSPQTLRSANRAIEHGKQLNCWQKQPGLPSLCRDA